MIPIDCWSVGAPWGKNGLHVAESSKSFNSAAAVASSPVSGHVRLSEKRVSIDKKGWISLKARARSVQYNNTRRVTLCHYLYDKMLKRCVKTEV